ncbi:MAG TPA: T9SS type A sorting domain-containing protein [Bacteroidota bacterium]
MNRLLTFFVVLTACGVADGSAGESSSPERLGAHWARVSDRAVVELIVDDLQAVAQGRASASVAQGHLAATLSASQLMTATTRATVATHNVDIQNGNAKVSFSTGQELQLKKIGSSWQVVSGAVPYLPAVSTSAIFQKKSGVTVGETFIETPVSREYSIERLSRGVTKSRIDRWLFGAPERTASYYSAHYMDRAPYVTATYIQFAVDPSWNRIVYGNLDRWVKAYTDVQGPTSIAVDADGRVFVGESGFKRISVLRVVGTDENAQLQPQFTIDGITNPTDISLSDNGTPLATQDDFLYVADASTNSIYKYLLSSSGAARVATFEGFDGPTSLAVGKWNGASSRLVYVVDKIAKRVRLFEDNGTGLSFIKEYQGTNHQYFTALKVDHFGNIYIVDNVNSSLMKFTASLELLDQQGGPEVFTSLAYIDIPFGKIEIDGQGTFWSGFDQMFAVERWSEDTGAQRRTLGLAMRDIDFRTDNNVSLVQNDFVLTDFADVAVKIFDEHRNIIRTLHSSWMVSGTKSLVWNRRDDEGKLVQPGSYKYVIESRPSYRDEKIVSQTQFSLPMYYWENAGSANALEDAHLVQGSAVRWAGSPAQTANEHASSVQYRFTGLNPESEYEIQAEYVAHDGARRMQDLTVNGERLHDPVNVTENPSTTGWLKMPKTAFANGDISVSVNRRAEGSAIISQLWIKETGSVFSAQQINELLPEAYALMQNYPNPFNPSTMIRYAIPQDGDVSLKIFDITGREVSTVVNEFKKAGSYEVRFDAASLSGGRSLASGIYFYHLKSGGFTQTKKMVLLK